jgi:hypothetical protein
MAEIGITRVSRWTFNCYVIHAGEGGPVIVDAGLPCLAADLAPVLADLAIDPAAAVAVAATRAQRPRWRHLGPVFPPGAPGVFACGHADLP